MSDLTFYLNNSIQHEIFSLIDISGLKLHIVQILRKHLIAFNLYAVTM